jgi:manganese/iron transport system ATP-binding protein
VPIFPEPVLHDHAAPIVAVRSIRVQYDGVRALEDISFELTVGERVAVVGPNGAGKSTLFKVIAGLLEPTQGTVNVSGFDPSGHVCIAYIPQRSLVDWTFPVNVTDVVMMGRIRRIGFFRWPTRTDRSVVSDALSLVGLSDLAGRQIGELSGGQQQRVFIARALAQEAELMLMDEPFTGLDVKSQQDIMLVLDELKGRHVTLLVATHDLTLAAESFDRLMLLNRRLIGFGHAQDVLTPDRLVEAYGGHTRVIPHAGDMLSFDDACCDGGHEHHD